MLPKKTVLHFLLWPALMVALSAQASNAEEAGYQLNPGDVLNIFVWNEESLSRETLVRPDGYISVPLAGQLRAGGKTPAEVEEELSERLSNYLKDRPTVTVRSEERRVGKEGGRRWCRAPAGEPD